MKIKINTICKDKQTTKKHKKKEKHRKEQRRPLKPTMKLSSDITQKYKILAKYNTSVLIRADNQSVLNIIQERKCQKKDCLWRI